MHTRQEQLPWEDLQAVKEGRVSLEDVRRGLQRVAAREHSWAGMPMPLEGQRLVIEPKFPRAKLLENICQREVETSDDAAKRLEAEFKQLRNSFWSWRWRSLVDVWETKDGKIKWGLHPRVHSADQQLATLACHDAWSLETEHVAMETLRSLVAPHIYKMYVLTGQFLETSKRSGVTYLFRRLRPTIAIRASPDGELRILCALCLHSIGYYAGTWAGAMVPSDDVLTHVLLMRGDEQMFWRRANQHPSWRPEAGI